MRDPAQPLRRRLYLVALLFVVFAIVIAASACEETGTPRGDALLQPQATAVASMGWRLRTDPPASYHPPDGVLGWTEEKTLTAWEWLGEIPDDAVAGMIAWHEAGHVWEFHTGRYLHDEARASQWGWCSGGQFIAGVGMPGWGPPPEGCEVFS